MTDPLYQSKIAQAVALLSHYCFEMKGYTAEELIFQWRETYSATWIRLAVIEALYQGRYKAISVEQILHFWERREQSTYHFNHEFERLICRKIPRDLLASPEDLAENLVPEDWYFTEPEPPIIQSSQPELETTSPTTNLSDNSAPISPEETPSAKQIFSPELLPETELQPETKSDKNKLSYQPDWTRVEVVQSPIHQFTPSDEASEFLLKLKAVAQRHELRRNRNR
ncbi:MAG: hypothetical protein SAJ37_03355 [Oscillatoria sp. PMC 1068.18]|nr:hypothetical protein [Oscillatoria sp. PMC 1076.18]MEC4987763.1 hypothetical protein [Oscillatoria sp. PMC 1068.18]